MISEIVQSSYVSLLNSVYSLCMKKLSKQTREFLIQVIFVVFALYFILFRMAGIYDILLFEQDICQFLGALLLMLVAFLSMDSEVRIVQWRNSLLLPMFLMGLIIIGVGLMHPIGGGYGFFGIMLISVYPCLYLAWNNRCDYEVLFDKIAIAFMSSGAIYFIYYLYLDYTNKELETVGRHTGGMANANFLSFLGIAVCCSALYLLYRCFQKIAQNNTISIIFSVTAMVMGFVLIIMGGSRSAILIFIACVATVIFIQAKNNIFADKEGNHSRLIILLVIGFLVAALCAAIALKNTSFLARFDFRNGDAEQFSSGRIGIWRSYASQLNILGHDMSNVDWEVLTAGIATLHAHNTFLEFSYRCGIGVGILIIVFQLVAGILTLIIMFDKHRVKDYEVFTILFSIHYLVLSLLDIATIPMTNYAAFFFYICVMPLFVSNKNNSVNESKYINKHDKVRE